MLKEIDINPLLPFTCDDLLLIMGVYKNTDSGVAENNTGVRCNRRVNAGSTPSHFRVPALSDQGERSVNTREQKALELADRGRVVKRPNGWLVYALHTSEKYFVSIAPTTCSCPDWDLRQEPCKHILAVQITLTREVNGEPIERPTETLPVKYPRKTYSQDWPNYDAAQQSEKKEFQCLLSDLCSMIPQPEPKGGAKGGRPPARLSDVIFASVFKVYCGLSGRRFAINLGEAKERGFISSTVHHSTIARCLEDPETTPLLIGLIETSALPFKAIETEFAVDSSGFSACRWDRWYDFKWGRMMSKQSWAKAHVICGTTTHIVASVIIEHSGLPDAPQLIPLVTKAARNFTIGQVSGDKAYASVENFEAVDKHGGAAYLAFKTNATGAAGGVYERMYHLFALNKEEYLAHYHRRSNIESLFSAVKRLFGDSVRSKSEIAMRNESLAKLLAYNITLLVHAIYELGLRPSFRDDQDEPPAILPMARPG
jgi:transposase